MKFNEGKKQSIKRYILEKISQQVPSISKTVANTFSVNPSTIHEYMNELIEDNVIKKIKRGQYELVSNDFTYELSRKNGDLDNDTYAFDSVSGDESSSTNINSNKERIVYYTYVLKTFTLTQKYYIKGTTTSLQSDTVINVTEGDSWAFTDYSSGILH